MLELKNFVELSKYAGERFDLVQGSGGNTSCRLPDDVMLIKASGYSLSDINFNTGYVKVNNEKVLDILDKNEIMSINDKNEKNDYVSKLLQMAFVDNAQRPSIEIFLHSMLHRYTLHIHPIVINAILCCNDWQDILSKLCPEGLQITYKTPGIELALEVKDRVNAYEQNCKKKPEVIFLQNHGLIISSDTIERIISLNEALIVKAENHLNCDMQRYKLSNRVSSLINSLENSYQIAYLSEDNQLLQVLKTNKENFQRKPFCPDTLVYCGVNAVEIGDLNDKRAIENYKEKYLTLPRVVIYKDHIFFVADNVRKAKAIEEIFKLHVMTLSISKGSCESLSDKELSYLANWEAEKYRQELNNG